MPQTKGLKYPRAPNQVLDFVIANGPSSFRTLSVLTTGVIPLPIDIYKAESSICDRKFAPRIAIVVMGPSMKTISIFAAVEEV